ncbi:hypothetical protein ACLOJK_013160 [Asimina triloba]
MDSRPSHQQKNPPKSRTSKVGQHPSSPATRSVKPISRRPAGRGPLHDQAARRDGQRRSLQQIQDPASPPSQQLRNSGNPSIVPPKPKSRQRSPAHQAAHRTADPMPNPISEVAHQSSHSIISGLIVHQIWADLLTIAGPSNKNSHLENRQKSSHP